MIPLPDGLEFEEWAAYVVEDFALDGIPTSLPWREFGERIQVYATNQLADLPRTIDFPDWRSWARRCMTFLA